MIITHNSLFPACNQAVRKKKRGLHHNIFRTINYNHDVGQLKFRFAEKLIEFTLLPFAR